MPIGKIYIIESEYHYDDECYIGSTTEKHLSTRLAKHNNNYKRFLNGLCSNCTSFKIIKYGDAYITLLENFEYKTKDELLKREGYWINRLKDVAVNKCTAGRTHKESRKNWVVNNRKKYNEYMKNYQRKHYIKKNNLI